MRALLLMVGCFSSLTRKNRLNRILIERLWQANRYSREELLDACLAADLRITGFKRFPITYFWKNLWGNIVKAQRKFRVAAER